MHRFLSMRSLTAYAFLSTAIFWAIRRLHPLTFNPVNGDFQTFNAVSRFLAGQWPYHDFANYLGIGPLVLTSVATWFSGATFASSVFGTDLIASLAFMYMATLGLTMLRVPKPWLYALVLYVIGRSPQFILLLPKSDVVSATFVLLDLFFQQLGIRHLSFPGHSLLPLRTVWPFLAALPLMYYLRTPTWRTAALLGATLGLGVGWSNDYGPMTALVFGLAAIGFSRRFDLAPIALLASIASLVGLVWGITGGHPTDWYQFNRAVAEDQFWYFYFPIYKVVSWSSVEFDATTIMLVLMWLLMASSIRRAHQSVELEDRVFATLFVTCTLVGTLSVINSHWSTYYFASSAMLSVLLLVRYLDPDLRRLFSGRRRSIQWGLGTFALVMAVATVAHPRYAPRTPDEMQLGARLSAPFDGYDAMMRFIRQGDRNLWSTYSTAVEASLGLHHPSGQDYIIHALGESGRRHYLDQFRAASPRLVITPRPDKIVWETWSRLVNWFFYRELIRRYAPVYHGPFWTIWAPAAEQPTTPMACRIHQAARNVVELHVQAPAGFANHVGDIEIAYDVTVPWGARPLVELQTRVMFDASRREAERRHVEHTNFVLEDSLGLPPRSASWPVPVTLDANGAGVATIRANVRDIADLHVSTCQARVLAPMNRFDK